MEWVDATEALFAGVRALNDSQMVHNPRFKYGVAMCAAEIMDPKMDMGMRLINRNVVQDRLASGELSPDLDAKTLLSVLDKLFQLEMSWRTGNSLPQSVFTYLFMHSPGLSALRSRVGLPPLREGEDGSTPPLPVGSRGHTLALAHLSYCCATLKLIDCERALVVSADIFEEDDMVVDTYGLDLLPTVPMNDIMCMLRDAETALLASAAPLRASAPVASAGAAAGGAGKKKKGGKSKLGLTVGCDPAPVSFPPDSRFSAPAAFEAIADTPADALAAVDGLVCRLRLKRAHIIAHLALVLPEIRGLPEADEAITVAIQMAQVVQSTLTPDVDTELAAAAVPSDPARRAEHDHFLKINPPTTSNSCLPGFFGGIVSALIPTAPPRFTPLAPYTSSIASYIALLNQLHTIAGLPHAVAPRPLPSSLTGTETFRFPQKSEGTKFSDTRPAPEVDLSRVMEFQQAMALRQPGIVVRSHLWMLTGHSEKLLGVYPLSVVVLDHLLSLGIPVTHCSREDMKTFAGRCAIGLFPILRHGCRGHLRKHRKVKPLLRDLNILQQDTLGLDLLLQTSFPVDSHIHLCHYYFIYGLACNTITQYIENSLTCGLFQDLDSILMAYWQLDYYMSCHYRTASFIHSSRCEAAWRSTKGKKSQKGKKGAPDAPLPPPPPAINLLILEVKRALARGSIFMLLAAIRLGLDSSPVYPFRDPEIQFRYRWLNLTSEMAQPSPVTYASFVSVKNTPKSVHALLESAANFFGDAKVKCDGLLKDGTIAAELFPGVKEYLQGCVKSAVANKVFGLQLSQRLPPPVPEDPADTSMPPTPALLSPTAIRVKAGPYIGAVVLEMVN